MFGFAKFVLIASSFASLVYPPHMGYPEAANEFPVHVDIPAAGQQTTYGIPLAISNAQSFADWFYSVQVTPEQAQVLQDVLSTIPAPCCDDNPVYACCCTKNEKICNLTRSARGLARWLLVEKGFSREGIRSAVEEWLMFLRPEYFRAKALEERGLDPTDYGLKPHEDYESCYAKACEVPLDAGGCGGMGLEVLLSQPENLPDCCRGEEG